jgi:hypothetical protein
MRLAAEQILAMTKDLMEQMTVKDVNDTLGCVATSYVFSSLDHHNGI